MSRGGGGGSGFISKEFRILPLKTEYLSPLLLRWGGKSRAHVTVSYWLLFSSLPFKNYDSHPDLK